MRKLILSSILFVFLALSCQSTSEEIEFLPTNTLSEQEQHELLTDLVRFYGRLPAKATHETKFDEEFDEEYQITIGLHRVDFYFHDEITGSEFLLLSRPARSLHDRRVAIGIEIERENRQLIHYKEHFRTWRMEPVELLTKSEYLFSKLVQRKSLEAYYPENSGVEFYIEFPNADTFFDTETRTWRAVSGSSLEELLNNTNRLERNS